MYNGAGIAKHGALGYLKHQTVPSGMKGPILVLLIPLEFMSNILVRPVTLALRLFANLFAGHLLLILFSTGAAYLVFESDKLAYVPVGILSLILGILVSFLAAAGHVPAGLRLHAPHCYVHRQRHRRRALSTRLTPSTTQTYNFIRLSPHRRASASQRKELPWTATST
ncbi:F0F1 ATP synthase subunit A [Aeromicrobium sp. UC242_57]|uniref:F0F1 ATP synthase subunit A n=1 Tax=Aeromicrobium sp. UC242_57 TaxID=3374624 RepID=UPI00379CA536